MKTCRDRRFERTRASHVIMPCAQADLIGQSPIASVFAFFRSKYFSNVRKSISIFMGAWIWYVLNTRTYIQPEYDD